MFAFSTFKHEWDKSIFNHELPISKDYKVYVNGTEVPVYTCRISEYPFNSYYPGYQRPIDQTEIVSFVNLVSDEKIEIEVEPLTQTAYERVMLKPYSKEVEVTKKGNRLSFALGVNGGYVLELDDYHGALYIFNNKPCPCENKDSVTYYFDKGVHFVGKLTLKSNESVYVDKDAYVYGCIFAENAENIKIFGNGIFDDSAEERVTEHCYEPFTNGNLKLYDCKNVWISGVGFTNSAMWCINIFHCFDLVLDGINVFGQWRYNTDGIDIVNSKRVTVKNSFVHSFDDSVTVKGIDRYAYEDNTDILVENCTLWCDWGRTLEIGFETECREYRDITFRNCDILRGAYAVCDIQNGDRAEVHNVTFEDIRVELESFYTPEVVQKEYSQKYNAKDKHEISKIFAITNERFRAHYSIAGGDTSDYEKPYFAGTHDILVKDIKIYCDEKIVTECGKKAVRMTIRNKIATTEYKNITVENIFFNGEKLTADDMDITIEGCEADVLCVR